MVIHTLLFASCGNSSQCVCVRLLEAGVQDATGAAAASHPSQGTLLASDTAIQTVILTLLSSLPEFPFVIQSLYRIRAFSFT